MTNVNHVVELAPWHPESMADQERAAINKLVEQLRGEGYPMDEAKRFSRILFRMRVRVNALRPGPIVELPPLKCATPGPEPSRRRLAGIPAGPPTRFTFDNASFGTSLDGFRTLGERMVGRPPSMRLHEWYDFCGALATRLNHHFDAIDACGRPPDREW